MEVLFRALYETEAVLEDAVHQWKAKGDEPDFDKALAQVGAFVTFLETAEEEN